MKIAVSNIAWPIEREAEIALLVEKCGYKGVEVAPTKMWPRLLEVTRDQVLSYRETWNSLGIEIVAIQSLLFGRPDLTVFGAEQKRTETLEYLRKVIEIAAGLGAGVLVFGSPKNRLAGGLSKEEVDAVAYNFFRRLGDIAQEAGVKIGIEANPKSYGADFLTSAVESTRFVKELDHTAVRLHLCSGCMSLAEDHAEERIREGARWLSHFHVSAPFLNHIDHPDIDHAGIAATLRSIDYKGWVSIEMKTEDPFSVSRVEDALNLVKLHYLQD